VLIRLAGLGNDEKAEIVANVIRDLTGELENAFMVISRRTLRIRPRL
jgi:hypothetical protein